MTFRMPQFCIKSFLLLLVLVIANSFFGQKSYAQGTRDENGEIEDQAIEIRKDIQITLPQLTKPFEVNRQVIENETSPPQKYTITDFKLNLPDVSNRINVAAIKPDPLPDAKKGLVQGGVGNYQTSYLEGWYQDKVGSQFAYQAHVKHLSSLQGPVKVIASGNSENQADFGGTYTAKKVIFSAKALANLQRFNFYGYAPENKLPIGFNEEVAQRFTALSFLGAVENAASLEQKLQYKITGGLGYFANRFSVRETEGKVNVASSYQLQNGKILVDIDNSFWSLSRDSGSIIGGTGRYLTQIRPRYVFGAGKAQLEVGFGLAFHNDQSYFASDGIKNFHFFPKLRGQLTLVPERLTIFAGIEGKAVSQSYRSFAMLNPFVTDYLRLNHTIERAVASLGVNGNIASRLNFAAEVTAGVIGSMPMFIGPRGVDSAKFNVAYYFPGGVTRYTSKVQLDYLTERYSVGARLQTQTFSYNGSGAIDSVNFVTYVPPVTIGGYFSIRPIQKLTLRVDGEYLAPAQGLRFGKAGERIESQVPTFLNIDLTADFQYNNQFSFFVKGTNLLNQKVERYLLYNTRGLLVMVGASYRF